MVVVKLHTDTVLYRKRHSIDRIPEIIMQHHVTIGNAFFAKAFNDYANWRWALGRELGQNSIDCGSKTITVTIAPEGSNTRLIWANDGPPMTKDILVNKFLSIGESGKDFNDGAVGGFGKAKELIALAHLEYTIKTGPYTVKGSGGQYDLSEGEILNGTEFSVLIKGDESEQIANNTERFFRMSQWRGVATINGKVIEDRLLKGRGRKNLSFGRVYTNNEYENKLIVRIGGIPMFIKYASYDGTVVLELSGKSVDVLQSSRDHLKYEYSAELDEFLKDLITNKRKALKEEEVTIVQQRYPGYCFAGKQPQPESNISQVSVESVANALKNKPAQHVTSALSEGGMQVLVSQSSGLSQTMVEARTPDFHIYNSTGLETPSWAIPDTFSTHAKTLLDRWIECLRLLANLTGNTSPFSVGFCVDEEFAGMHTYVDGQSVIYVKPCDIVKSVGKATVMKTKWKLSGDSIWDLVAVAIHEWCHHEGFSSHDERYAGRLTDLINIAMRERSEFAKIFQRKVQL